MSFERSQTIKFQISRSANAIWKTKANSVTQTVGCKHPLQFIDLFPGSTFTYNTCCSCAHSFPVQCREAKVPWVLNCCDEHFFTILVFYRLND